MTTTNIANEDIVRAKAHALWLEEGRPDGRAEFHWFRAIELVKAETGAEAAAPQLPKRKAAPRKRA